MPITESDECEVLGEVFVSETATGDVYSCAIDPEAERGDRIRRAHDPRTGPSRPRVRDGHVVGIAITVDGCTTVIPHEE